MSELGPARGGESVKAALIEAACDGLADAGPRALSTRGLAENAGVNHGQIHHYFGGKRGLLKSAMAALASEHSRNALERSGGELVPPALSLMHDTRYWRAIAHAVLEGDLDLVRVEMDEGISVPQRGFAGLREKLGVADSDIGFKADAALQIAAQLGYVTFEPFVMLLLDVGEENREALRDRVKARLEQMFSQTTRFED